MFILFDLFESIRCKAIALTKLDDKKKSVFRVCFLLFYSFSFLDLERFIDNFKSHSLLSHFSPLCHKFCHQYEPPMKSTHTLALRHVSICGVPSSSYSYSYLSSSYATCWMLVHVHRLGRPSGVDHINGSERRMNSKSIVSHATLILYYHTTMLALQKSPQYHLRFGCHKCDTMEFRVK